MFTTALHALSRWLHPPGNFPSNDLSWFRARDMEVLHLEISYRCNLDCVMCPRGFGGIPENVMGPEVFGAVEPYFDYFKCIHLVGYGEPLLNPRFLEFLSRAKDRARLVVITTNGTLLKGSLLRDIVARKPDHLTVSIDAGTAATYAAVRGQDLFDRVLENLAALSELRRQEHPDLWLEWTFVAMQSNYRELPQALEHAIRLGFNRFGVNHMETAHSPEALGEALFATGIAPPPSDETIADLRQVVSECRKMAAGKIDFHLTPFEYNLGGHCLARPTTGAVVDYRGNVSPCCYLGAWDSKPYLLPEKQTKELLGNVLEAPLPELFNTPVYNTFRDTWLAGKVPPKCAGCLQLARMQPQPFDEL